MLPWGLIDSIYLFLLRKVLLLLLIGYCVCVEELFVILEALLKFKVNWYLFAHTGASLTETTPAQITFASSNRPLRRASLTRSQVFFPFDRILHQASFQINRHLSRFPCTFYSDLVLMLYLPLLRIFPGFHRNTSNSIYILQFIDFAFYALLLLFNIGFGVRVHLLFDSFLVFLNIRQVNSRILLNELLCHVHVIYMLSVQFFENFFTDFIDILLDPSIDVLFDHLCNALVHVLRNLFQFHLKCPI